MKAYFSDERKKEEFRNALKSWLGTPHWHNVAVKGRGCDCASFIAASLLELGILTKLELPKYLPRDWHIHTTREYFLENFNKHQGFLKNGFAIVEISKDSELWFGDWLIFSLSPKRLLNRSAIYFGDNKIIHSIQPHGVRIDNLPKYYPRLRKVYRLFEK